MYLIKCYVKLNRLIPTVVLSLRLHNNHNVHRHYTHICWTLLFYWVLQTDIYCWYLNIGKYIVCDHTFSKHTDYKVWCQIETLFRAGIPSKTKQKTRVIFHTRLSELQFSTSSVIPSPVRAARLARSGGSAMAWRPRHCSPIKLVLPPPPPGYTDSKSWLRRRGAAGSPQNIAPLLYIVTYIQTDIQTDTAGYSCTPLCSFINRTSLPYARAIESSSPSRAYSWPANRDAPVLRSLCSSSMQILSMSMAVPFIAPTIMSVRSRYFFDEWISVALHLI